MIKLVVRLEKIAALISHVPAVIAAGMLFVLMLLTVAGVFMRKVMADPIIGMQEYSEACLVVVIFFFLTYSGWTGGQIAVDLISSVVKGTPRRVLFSLISAISAGLMGIISWQLFKQGSEVGELGMSFNLTLIPHEPFYYIAGIGCGFYTLVLVVMAWRLALGLPEVPEE